MKPTIDVAGYRDMVGSAIVRVLDSQGQSNVVTRTNAELDRTNRAAVRAFFEAEKPDPVYLAAAKVGGLHANNTYPAEFIYQNLMIEANAIHEAWRVAFQKLLFLGSSCIYPKLAPQPMSEDALLTGTLEPTKEPYAIAKIAGIKHCESYNRLYGESHGTDYRSVMPTNLYGPGDNDDLQNSYVIPAMIRKLNLAELVDERNWPTIEADERTHGRIPEDLRHHLDNTCTRSLAPCAVLLETGTPTARISLCRRHGIGKRPCYESGKNHLRGSRQVYAIPARRQRPGGAYPRAGLQGIAVDGEVGAQLVVRCYRCGIEPCPEALRGLLRPRHLRGVLNV